MDEGSCAVCQKPARNRCAACHQVFYCTREHQKEDWTRGHKKRCRKQEAKPSFKIEEDVTLGRHLVAIRDLNIGELVLREAPLVEAPSQFTPPVCVICYNQLTPEDAQACEKCGWPVCGRQECIKALKTADNSHTPECEATVKAEKRVNIALFDQHHPSYQSLAIIRCLQLRDTNPELWNNIMSLQSHCEERKATPRYENDRSTIGNFILNYLKFAKNEITEDEILKLCGILQVNGHEVPSSDPPHVALCYQTSLLEHSCVPNCARRFASRDGGSRVIVEVRTLRPILQGEHLSICYSDPLWGTANRRMQLKQTKFFDCKCVRCSDSSELGTMLSAVRCLINAKCSGFLLPISPLESDSKWKCGTCQGEEEATKVETLLQQVGIQLSSLPQGDCDALEKFITQVSGCKLHPNHYYVTDARLALCQMWGIRCGPGGLSAEPDHVVATKLKTCEELRILADKLAPGPTALRGLILMELQASKSEESRRRLFCGDLDTAGLRVTLTESRRWLVEAVEILKFEAASPQDRDQANRATLALKELDIFLHALPKS